MCCKWIKDAKQGAGPGTSLSMFPWSEKTLDLFSSAGKGTLKVRKQQRGIPEN